MRLPEYTVLLSFVLGVLCGVGCSPFVVPPSREILCLMLPFAFSLVLPLLAGVNTPTWSLVSWTIQRPGTDEAAGLLLPGTWTWLVVEALPPTNPAPPWWMLCGWTGSPRSPEPAAAGVAACYFDDRYQKFGDTGAGAATAAAAVVSFRFVLLQVQAHTRAPASLRDREGGFEPRTMELATARKTAAADSSYAAQTRGVISVIFLVGALKTL